MADDLAGRAKTIMLLIHHGVIAESRYTDHQLAIYTGVPKAHIEWARRLLERHGPEDLRPPLASKPARKGTGQRARPTPEEAERDAVVAARRHEIEIRRAKPLQMLAAHFEAHEGDDCVGEECQQCGRPIQVGERARIVGAVEHEDCP